MVSGGVTRRLAALSKRTVGTAWCVSTHLQVPLVELHGHDAGHGINSDHLAAVDLAANAVAKIARRHRAQRAGRLVKHHGHELQPLRREEQRVLSFSLQCAIRRRVFR